MKSRIKYLEGEDAPWSEAECAYCNAEIKPGQHCYLLDGDIYYCDKWECGGVLEHALEPFMERS